MSAMKIFIKMLCSRKQSNSGKRHGVFPRISTLCTRDVREQTKSKAACRHSKTKRNRDEERLKPPVDANEARCRESCMIEATRRRHDQNTREIHVSVLFLVESDHEATTCGGKA